MYPGKFDEKEVDKLAYENARYMISVFCPTAMVYSLPFRNIFYVLDWTEQMKKNYPAALIKDCMTNWNP